MEIRIEKIITYLCQYDDYQAGLNIADYCGISERTLYRLIPHVQTWLSHQGWALKSKTRKGYKIIGDRQIILSMLKNEKYNYLSLTKNERHEMIILFLVMNDHPVRIKDIATALCMSDTCINNDITEVDEYLAQFNLNILKEKGSGLSIAGDEFSIRCCFVSIFTKLVPSDVFIHYLYPENDDVTAAQKKIDRFFAVLKINEDWEILKNLIKTLERKLGYHFSYSGFSTFLLFLVIIKRRFNIGSKEWADMKTDLHPDYRKLALSMLQSFFPDSADESGINEIDSLAAIIAGMEIGDISQATYDTYFSGSREMLSEILDETLVKIEGLTGYFLSFDRQLKNCFIASLSALLIRSVNNIPIWHEVWLYKRKENYIENEFSDSIISMISERTGIVLTHEQLQNLQFSFSAIFEDTKKAKRRKIRTCIVCFEGIGLATYLKSRMLQLFPDLYIVDLLSYHRIDRAYIEDNYLDLIITTYKLPEFDIPSYIIDLPINESDIFNSLHSLIEDIKRKSIFMKSDHRDVPAIEEPPDTIPLETILPLIENFFCIVHKDITDINSVLDSVINLVDMPKKSRTELHNDFMNRESHGDLIFHEWGVRVLHCRSRSIAKPLAGVVQTEKSLKGNAEYSCILVMAAPVDADKKMLKGLSSLITALSDESEFARILAHSPLKTIQEFLFWMYGNFIHFDAIENY